MRCRIALGLPLSCGRQTQRCGCMLMASKWSRPVLLFSRLTVLLLPDIPIYIHLPRTHSYARIRHTHFYRYTRCPEQLSHDTRSSFAKASSVRHLARRQVSKLRDQPRFDIRREMRFSSWNAQWRMGNIHGPQCRPLHLHLR